MSSINLYKIDDAKVDVFKVMEVVLIFVCILNFQALKKK